MSALTTSALHQKIRFGRRIEGISAVLLPFLADGQVDEAGFRKLLERTFASGLIPAVNMDAGYVNLLHNGERLRVLDITKEVAAERPFVAGASISGKVGGPIPLFREQIQWIYSAGGLPIIFPSESTKMLDRPGLINLFKEIGLICPQFLAVELNEIFAPYGKIFDLDLIKELMQIPSLSGIMYCSLERELEWQRLSLRDKARPDFKIYSGNELAIDQVMYGSDYLLGLSAFYPEAFALRDALWERQDVGFYQLNDLLQYLGFLAFRAPIPGYKHTAAQFLHLRRLIKTPLSHPKGVTRPESDLVILQNILVRLDALVAQYQYRVSQPVTST